MLLFGDKMWYLIGNVILRLGKGARKETATIYNSLTGIDLETESQIVYCHQLCEVSDLADGRIANMRCSLKDVGEGKKH